jgi:hypothetical protein
MQITYCPPSPERPFLNFDKAQFNRRHYPIEATYVSMRNAPEANGWRSTGLSFGDYGNMQTTKRKGNGSGGRRLNTPEYMFNEKRFRSVVIRYLEVRAGLLKKQSGTEVERMQRVSALLKQRAEETIFFLDKYCAMYVAATDDAERKRFQRRVEEYDTTVRLCREPWAIPQIARAYYLERLDSVGVGNRVGFKSPHVRQILKRLADLDAEMQAGTDARGTESRTTEQIVATLADRAAAKRALLTVKEKRQRKLQYMRNFMENRREAARTLHGKRKMTLTEVTAYAGSVSCHKRHHVNRGIVNPKCELCRAKESAPPEQSACLPSFPTSFDELHLHSEQAQGVAIFA